MEMNTRFIKVIIAIAVILIIASEGLYDKVTAQLQCPPYCYHLIGDAAWVDQNGNGIQDDGPSPMDGIKVELYRTNSSGGLLSQTPIASDTTQQGGIYQFDTTTGYYRLKFPDGIYLVGGSGSVLAYTLSPQDVDVDDFLDSDARDGFHERGWTPTIEDDGEALNGNKWDVGYVPVVKCKSLGNTIWRDNNDDGIYSVLDDTPISGAEVELWKLTGAVPGGWQLHASDITDGSGRYEFEDMDCGPDYDNSYRIVVRNSGLLAASPWVDPDAANMEDHDNNCMAYTGEGLPGSISTEGLVGVTNEFEIRAGHPGTDYAIDCGFACEAGDTDIVFVFDRSKSAHNNGDTDPLKMAKMGSKQITSQLDGTTKLRVAVISFGSSPTVHTQGLTTNKADANGAVNGVQYNATDSKSNTMSGIAAARSLLNDPQRTQVIVLYTIGEANATLNSDPDADPREDAIWEAVQAKQNGTRIILVTVGYPSASTLALASSQYDVLLQPTRKQLPEAYGMVAQRICGAPGAGRQYECTGDRTYYEELSTGINVSGGVDQNWYVSSGGGGYHPFVPVPDHRWPALEGAKWVSHDIAGNGGAGTKTYTTTFTMDDVIKSRNLQLDLIIYGDGVIAGVYLNDALVSGSAGGAIGGKPLWTGGLLGNPDWSYYVAGENTLRVLVEDNGGREGLLVLGGVRACIGPDPVVRDLWRPYNGTCTETLWSRQNKELRDVPVGPKRDRLPKRITHRTTGKNAYCMRVHYACCRWSKLVEASSCASNDTDCSTCGAADLYDFPDVDQIPQREFDVGLRKYAAIKPDTYYEWPNPQQANGSPGRLILTADSGGAYPEMVYANADKSYYRPGVPGAANIMERYVSTCDSGEVDKDDNSIMRCADSRNQTTWVMWDAANVYPMDCPSTGYPGP
jgi:hypothetical protein